MDVINVVRQLTKGKVQLCELDMPLPEKKRIQIEALLQTARAYLVQIKKKIKEKSEFTKLFKSNLTDDERASLKQKVSVLSKEIKEVESALKVCEQELTLVLERQSEERIPLQFQFSSEDCTVAESTTFQVMNDINSWASDWKQFLSTFTAHSSYHRIEWLNVLSAYSGFNVYLFVVKVEGKIVAGLPTLFMKSRLFGNNQVSLPYVNYGGILSLSKRYSEALLAGIKNWVSINEVDYFELRMTQECLNLPLKKQKCSMILTLPRTDDELEERIGAKVRAQYKKALESNVSVIFGGIELLNDFYYIFCKNMRDLGTPVYSKTLFEKILNEKLIDSFICVVKIDGKPVSAAFLSGYRDVLEIPWASTLRSANKFNVNMYMYRIILAKAIDLGYEFFDFGRSTKNSSTFRFKKQWGATPVEHFWYYLLSSGTIPETNPDNPKYRLAISIWQRLPVWLTNIIGPPIVKNIP